MARAGHRGVPSGVEPAGDVEPEPGGNPAERAGVDHEVFGLAPGEGAAEHEVAGDEVRHLLSDLGHDAGEVPAEAGRRSDAEPLAVGEDGLGSGRRSGP